VQHFAAELDEATAHEKIARQVAHQRQLGGNGEASPAPSGFTGRRRNQRSVAAQIAGRRINL